MSKFKNMPGFAWLVIGVCVTALVLPSAAYATGVLKQVGIEGTSGQKANVTAAGQILATETPPASYESYENTVDSADGDNSHDQCVVLATPTTGDAIVVRQVDVTVAAVDGAVSYSYSGDIENGTQGSGEDAVASVIVAAVPTSTGCASTTLGIVVAPILSPTSPLDLSFPVTPGYVVPAGYELVADGGATSAVVVAEGYSIPASEAPVAPQAPKNESLHEAAQHLLK